VDTHCGTVGTEKKIGKVRKSIMRKKEERQGLGMKVRKWKNNSFPRTHNPGSAFESCYSNDGTMRKIFGENGSSSGESQRERGIQMDRKRGRQMDRHTTSLLFSIHTLSRLSLSPSLTFHWQ